jgi:hypothetical protein
VKELKLALIGPESVATIVESCKLSCQPLNSVLSSEKSRKNTHTESSEKGAQPHTAHGKDKTSRARLIGDRNTANIVLSPLLPGESLQIFIVLFVVCLTIAIAA